MQCTDYEIMDIVITCLIC